MIAALEKEELFNRLYHGTDDELVEKERIITGTLEGIPFKCKIDSLNLCRRLFHRLENDGESSVGKIFDDTSSLYEVSSL